ncbi:hypothetical protein OCF84_21280 (plasmid) [Shewanella xiamenensis]|uniref:Uncharacterized protein n=1 Tax=Shewanella xiamenensis TaxID=332186 RepID=A0ABT6UDP4_9GAMM|nr:hypothetical protein [Shewanella xiamenensis]MDI5832590.1 hypothetical protein [Shewanella xiamenensis]WHF57792.1 hypothetical protein OCF84_21280 [Shewanella xiamenensis]
MIHEYSNMLISSILSFDASKDVSPQFVNSVFEDDFSVTRAVEDFFSDESFNVFVLRPLEVHPNQIFTPTRPYITINAQAYAWLSSSGHKYHTTPSGKILTFAEVTMHGDEQVYAVMPIKLVSNKVD